MASTTGAPWRLGHRPALDGLRGIAVLLVVLSHAFAGTFMAAGPVGVSIFFALSGFLITALLLEERDHKGRVRLTAFYWRRALRLLPALLACLAVITLFRAALGIRGPSHLTALLLYIGNWVTATGGDLGMAEHMWSLAVEEQFYIVFPVVALAILRVGERRVLLGFLVLSILASDLARMALFASDGLFRAYAGTDTNAAALLLGCLLAVALHGSRMTWKVPTWAAALPLAGMVPLCVVQSRAVGMMFAPMVASILAVLVLFLLMHADPPGWLTAGWLVTVGKRSYGFYLWHYPLVLVAVLCGAPWWALLLVIAASWGVTCLSWRYLEEPALRLKSTPPRTVIQSLRNQLQHRAAVQPPIRSFSGQPGPAGITMDE